MAQTFTYRQKPQFPKIQVAFGSSLAVMLGSFLFVIFPYLEDSEPRSIVRLLLFVGLSFLLMLVFAIATMIVAWNSRRRHFEANQNYSPWARPIDPSLGQGGRVWSPNSWE